VVVDPWDNFQNILESKRAAEDFSFHIYGLFHGYFFIIFRGDIMSSINFKRVRYVLWIILFANLLVAFLKILFGTAVQSASITADGIHSLTDGSSNIVGIIGIAFASKPVDEDHPYGHKKFETLTSMFISVMLTFAGGNIIKEGFLRFSNPVIPEITVLTIVTLILTIIINIFVCIYEYAEGKKLKSEILISDSIHTRSDIFISFGVLITVICVKLGLPAIIDSVVSMLVSIFIFHAAYEIFAASSGVLLDKAAVDKEKIKDIVMKFSNVKDAHDIRSRGKEDDIYIDMHIMLDPNMSVEESHKLIHDIEEKVQQELNKNTQLIVHIEPYEE
jgi:cation diffusion facilitator family transporter